jgi:penicillin-binding protein 1A
MSPTEMNLRRLQRLRRAPRVQEVPAGNGSNGAERRKPKLRKLRAALVLSGLALLAFVSWIFGIMMAVAQDLPQLEDRAQYEAAQNSVVYDHFGNRLTTLTNNAGRILINSEQIAPVMKEATVAIEDRRFYEHRGVDWIGIGRAVETDILSGGSAQGASTITQQFVKNALRAQRSRTVFEKLREAALAYHLERQWPKDKILTEYLNEIYFGEGAYGIEAAARTYFGADHPGCGTPGDRCASDLYPWEAAMLAGIISSPTGYDPRSDPEAAKARRDQVLQDMTDQGYITEAERIEYSAKALPPPSQIHTSSQNSKAPYFTSWLRQQLVDLYGAGEAFSGGLHIKSTLDLPLENTIQGIVDSRLAGLGPSSAVVVLDNKTGGVRAMLGGLDYSQEPFNVAALGARQPGSSFKPFTLVTALDQGHSTDEVFTSAPQELPFRVELTKNGKTKILPDLFRVSNYGDEYLGSASIATATTYSDNSVYSQLGMQVGPANVAATAEKMGITSDLSSDFKYSVNDGPFAPYNPALILGGLQTGVNPLEMAHAYETIAQSGQLTSGTMAAQDGGPVGVEEVTSDGKPVETNNGASGVNEPANSQVIPAANAQTARTILESVVQYGTGRRANTGDPNEFGKTGTTEDNGDAWFVGATDDITVAIWVGFPNSVEPMLTEYNGAPVDGGTIPAELFNSIVTAYDQLKADRAAGQTPSTTAPSTVAPAAPSTATPTTSAPSTSAPATPDTTGGGGSATGNQTAPAPTTPPATGGGGDSGGVAPVGGGVGAG